MKRITIKDIARELNLHHSTVSRALRNNGGVKEETRKKVNEYAIENGYRINMSALHLRGSYKNTLAVVVPNINHNFFSNIISVFTNLAFQKGYVVSVFQSNESFQQEKEIINTLIKNNVAGVAASIAMETNTPEHFELLNHYRIPMVFFDRICPGVIASKVTVDNFSALFDVVSILTRKGCKRVAHITGDKHIDVFRERQLGYSEGLKRNNLNYCRSVEIHSGFDIETGLNATAKLLNEDLQPDAIICDSHILTLGAIFKIRELGLKIPDDIMLAGFGDNPFVQVTSSKIITIIQPDAAIAEAAFELLIKKLENNENDIVENLTFSVKILEPDEYNN
ncbi:MAG: LacI family DNA-binding transcriptional regulator [Prolixibacteraceae bacterium]|nr:LacI family DNA-binding transcriptional regulator [Prolixibacteraceae bacterium]